MKLKIGIILGLILLGIVGLFLYKSLHYVAQLQTAEVNGIKLSYYTRGRGEPVLLFGDFGMNMSQWDPAFIQRLAQSSEVIIFDYRGVGNSSGTIDGLSKDLVLSDAAKLVETLKHKKVTVLGWAGGSTVAQLFVQKYPEMVDKVVLASSTPGDDETVKASDMITSKLESTSGGSWEEAILPYLFYSEDGKKAYLARLDESKKQNTTPSAPAVPSSTRKAYQLVFGDKITEQNRLAGLKRMTNKTFLIDGEDDEVVLPDNGQKMKILIKDAELADIPGAGHAVLFEKPNEASQMIIEFLNK